MSYVFNSVSLTPDKVLAGDSVEFIARLVIGPKYVSGPTRMVIDFPGILGITPPSLLHQEENGFVEVYVSNPNVTWTKRLWDFEIGRFVERGSPTVLRGRSQRCVVVDFSGGLGLGEIIEFHWGDTGRGFGPGTKVPIVVPASDGKCVIHLRYFDSQEKGLPDMGRSVTGCPRPIPDDEVALTFMVLPREMERLRVLRSHRRAALLPLDRFWNLVPGIPFGDVVELSESPVASSEGVSFFEKDVRVVSKNRAIVLDSPAMDNVHEGMHIFWGDVHAHSAFSCDCITRARMSQCPGDLMKFACNRALLDFFAVTDHHHPYEEAYGKHLIGEENWRETIEAIEKHHTPGEFVVFPGIEYRSVRGDTVVLFATSPEYHEILSCKMSDIRGVWESFRDREILTIPHFHNPGELPLETWWSSTDKRIEPTIEIFSCHGSYEREDAVEQRIPMIKDFRRDRNALWLLRQGYQYGFVCNSDGHKGHVGMSGLTAVIAEDLSRDAIFNAYRARRVYGTTNARIRLLFTGNGALMGSILKNSTRKEFLIDVVGEGLLKRIDLFRNGDCFKQFAPDGIAFRAEVTEDSGEPSHWYVRVVQRNSQIAWSSPIWFD